MTLSEIRRATQSDPVTARTHVQVESVAAELTREQQPYCKLGLADACDRITLRVWSDHPSFKTCSGLKPEDFIELTGEFFKSQYGMDARKWTMRPLSEQEKNELLQGPAELRNKQAADFEFVQKAVREIGDPRLRALADLFLAEFGDRFRRTAAARKYHHARRGGLVEHTSQMMRVALAVAPLYPDLNKDLLVAGVLFHDSGKLWENALPENGFVMGYDELGELVGHIPIGMELVNALWRKVIKENEESWRNLSPPSEDVRLHLLHLIAAHHGEKEMGSPVEPRTPEAMALHYIDNLDARMEMFAGGYLTSRALAPRILERVWPLPGNLVKSLEKFSKNTDDEQRLL